VEGLARRCTGRGHRRIGRRRSLLRARDELALAEEQQEIAAQQMRHHELRIDGERFLEPVADILLEGAKGDQGRFEPRDRFGARSGQG
jgi:hypothetical protein